MPMNKAIAGEGEGWNQVKPGIIGFTLAFQNTPYIPWAKTNIIIANPDIIIANPNIIIANRNMIIANRLSAISCQLLIDETSTVNSLTFKY